MCINIAFFGSSLLSAYWNGAATYYRGIIYELNRHGHSITFYEPDVLDRRKHCDLVDPNWVRSVIYSNTEQSVVQQVREARKADLIIKASGVGAFDEFLERAVLDAKTADNMVLFWDVDAPATLDRVAANAQDPFRSLIPKYDAILTYGGGEPVVRAYRELGARTCKPIYNALNRYTHFPVTGEARYASDVSFLGNRLPDRERRVEEYFFRAAKLNTSAKFILGGSGWEKRSDWPNVNYLGHVYTGDHNAFNCSAKMVLNISRESMAKFGYSPATRIFEAAGAGACIITDAWEGVDEFFEPGQEILVAHCAEDVANFLNTLTPGAAAMIGRAARRRALAEHTYDRRAKQLEHLLESMNL